MPKYSYLEERYNRYHKKRITKLTLIIGLTLSVIIGVTVMLFNSSSNEEALTIPKSTSDLKPNKTAIPTVQPKSTEVTQKVETNQSIANSEKNSSFSSTIKTNHPQSTVPKATLIKKENFEFATLTPRFTSHGEETLNFDTSLIKFVPTPEKKSKDSSSEIPPTTYDVIKTNSTPKKSEAPLKPKPSSGLQVTIHKEDPLRYHMRRYREKPNYESAIAIAREAFGAHDYTAAAKWAERANQLDQTQEESWLVFAESLHAKGSSKQALKVLKTYIDATNSKIARTRYAEIKRSLP